MVPNVTPMLDNILWGNTSLIMAWWRSIPPPQRFDLPSVPKSGHSSGEVIMDELHLDIRLLSLFLLLGTTGLRWGFLHLVLTHLDPFVI
jgi:hypothetical protein